MRTTALGSCALLVATLTMTTAPAHADPTPTCAGHPATVVGTRGQTVLGTAGDDVIVAAHPKSVDAGSGDDVVCVAQGDGTTDVDLGPGADTFVSDTPGGFRIDTGDGEEGAAGRPPSHDVVTTTAAGSSEVHSGWADLPDDDEIALGGYGDRLYLDGLPTGRFTAATYDLGVPDIDDQDQLYLTDPVPHGWQIDGTAGTVRLDGRPATTLAGWEVLGVKGLAWSSFDVVGTPGTDVIRATGPVVGPGPLTASLGAGDDEMLLSPTLTGTVDGGSGKDETTVRGLRHGRLTGDLRMPLTGTWTWNGRPGVALRGFEYGDVGSVRHAVLLGNARPNTLSLNACTGEVDGGGRTDQIFLREVSRCSPLRAAFVARGGRGNDWMQGSGVGDLLVGGPGHDYAEDDGRHDRCVVERARCG